MPLTAAIVAAIAAHCAASVAPETLVSIVQVESGFDPLVIGVNGAAPRRVYPRSLADATDQASRLIASGASIDLGLGQINSTNLARLGLTVPDAFDACRNLRAAGRILETAYLGQAPMAAGDQAALRRALSIYNTGRSDRGFRNGYVARVTAAAGAPAPVPAPRQPAAPAQPWDVFGQADARLVFSSNSPGGTP